MARPAQLAWCGCSDIADLAAAYICGLASNHGFIDGNKRTAWVTGRLFVAENGRHLTIEPLDAFDLVEGVAAGRVGESDLATWLRSRLRD